MRHRLSALLILAAALGLSAADSNQRPEPKIPFAPKTYVCARASGSISSRETEGRGQDQESGQSMTHEGPPMGGLFYSRRAIKRTQVSQKKRNLMAYGSVLYRESIEQGVRHEQHAYQRRELSEAAAARHPPRGDPSESPCRPYAY